MNDSSMWGNTLPRLHELYCENPTNPDNYFNQPRIRLTLLNSPPDPHFIGLESILEELDSVAWQEWKGRAAQSLSVKVRFRFYVPLFDGFNEARAYVFLKCQGCTDISFLQSREKEAKKTPDLSAKDSLGRCILLEARRIHDSADEIEYLLGTLERASRNVRHGSEEVLETKLRSTFDKARKQLLAYPGGRETRRIAYLSICCDSDSATQKTLDEIGQLFTTMSDGTIEIVHFIENRIIL